MIGRHQMLAPVLIHFHRAAEAERGETNQDILRIDFAAHTKPATDVTFVQMHGRWFSGQAFVPARRGSSAHLGGAVHFEDAAALSRDGASRFHRRTAVAPDFKV